MNEGETRAVSDCCAGSMSWMYDFVPSWWMALMFGLKSITPVFIFYRGLILILSSAMAMNVWRCLYGFGLDEELKRFLRHQSSLL